MYKEITITSPQFKGMGSVPSYSIGVGGQTQDERTANLKALPDTYKLENGRTLGEMKAEGWTVDYISGRIENPEYKKFEKFMTDLGYPEMANYNVWRGGASEINVAINNYKQNLERAKRMYQEAVNWEQQTGAKAPEKTKQMENWSKEYDILVSKGAKAMGVTPTVDTSTPGYQDVSKMVGGTPGAGTTTGTPGTQGATKWYKSPQGNIFQAPEGSETAKNFLALGYTEATEAEAKASGNIPTDTTGGVAGGTTTGTAQKPQYQILDVSSMSKYTPDQYERLADGAVVLKSGVTPVAGTTKTYGGTLTYGGTTGTTGTTGATGITGADTQWITDLYKKYTDRTPTQAEITSAQSLDPTQLETSLGATYGTTSTYFKTNQTKAITDALAIIDASNLPDELKTIYKAAVNTYPDGIEYSAGEIINTFNKLKQDTIDPYFKEQVNLVQESFRQSLASSDEARRIELEQERATAGQDIRQAKAGLEKSGMTFSGAGIEALGKESAYAQTATPEVVTPTQEPFGGLFYEGTIPQASRLQATSSQARWAANQASTGLEAEKALGTTGLAAAGGVTGYKPLGGITGTVQETKTEKYASTLNDILDQYRQKQASLLNTQV